MSARSAPDKMNEDIEGIIMEENTRRDTEEDPVPLTDEEFVEFQKKEKRKVTIIGDIIDFIVNFFR